MSLPIKLIVGLGNPGSKYAMTRHNAGFWFMDSLAAHYHLHFRMNDRFHASCCRIQSSVHSCFLFKPLRFMNASGDVVWSVSQYHKIQPDQIMVIHDEIDLPAGQVRFKQGGGHGGHNGVRDIIDKIHSQAFVRLRIGVGRPAFSKTVTDYVLDSPDQAEDNLIREGIQNVLSEIPMILDGHISQAMNIFNRSS